MAKTFKNPAFLKSAMDGAAAIRGIVRGRTLGTHTAKKAKTAAGV